MNHSSPHLDRNASALRRVAGALLALLAAVPAGAGAGTELPCPIRSMTYRGSNVTPGFRGVSRTKLEACAAAMNAMALADRPANAGKLLIQLETVKAFSDQPVVSLENIGALEELKRLLKEAGLSLPLACTELGDDLDISATLSAARPLPPGRSAVSLTLAQLEFDTLDGEDIPPEDQAEVWLAVLTGAYGVNERIELALVVPLQSLDLPTPTDPSDPAGRHSGLGDVTLEGLIRLSPRSYARTVVSLDAAVTFAVGDEDRLLGTGHTAGRLGVVADRFVTGSWFTAVPYASVWASSSGGDSGIGFAAGADFPVTHALGLFVGATSDYEGDADYVDGYAGVRIGSHRTYSGAPPRSRTDGNVTVHWSLNDEGIRPSAWLAAGLQFLW